MKANKLQTFYLTCYSKTLIRKLEKISDTIEFPKSLTVLGNLAVILWIALGSLAFWLFNQVVGWLFLVVTLIATYGVLKFLGCLRPCYQCKNVRLGLAEYPRCSSGNLASKTQKKAMEWHPPFSFTLCWDLFQSCFCLFLLLNCLQSLKSLFYFVY